MKAAWHVLLLLATAAIAAVIIGGMGYIMGVRNPGFAFWVNWIVMTWVAIISGVWGFQLPLPPSYFRIRRTESEGRLYELLGVRVCKRLLIRGPLAALNPSIRYAGTRSSLAKLEGAMQASEASHLLIFLIIMMTVVYAAVKGWWDLAAWLMAFNILINVYPIMLQRYNRARLTPILERARRTSRPETEA